MIPQQFFYQREVLGLLWLFVMLHDAWPSRCMASPPKPAKPIMPPPKRSSDPKPFPGLTRKPPCASCEQAHKHDPEPPGCPSPRGRHLRRDSLSSILYAEELNSITISATRQTTDRRHEILDQKSADFQLAL